MRKRSRGRDVHGMLALDKPTGITSNEAVQRVKRLFRARKVGHTGSLDPLATGVLPLCLGAATRFSQFLLDSDKRYFTCVRLGIATDSGDADGEVIATASVEGIDRARVDAALEAFRGEFEQVPSMYSAVKHQGQPLYKLARQGIEVEREARPVTVFENRIVDFTGDLLTLDIHCSKGTYVRTIAEELGQALGCGAHVSELRRTQAGPYGEADLVTFEALESAHEEGRLDAMLQPVSSAVREWPCVALTTATAWYVKQGQPVQVPHAPSSGWVRLAEHEAGEDRFVGVGEILEDGRVAPRRLVGNGGG
ncbi:MAG: tRNA pseudouridine(55) synthase TruB [Gammaproteobacteria bacterium]|nr:tRNA pseudouridine(55) synthase TruB [Gammaproteobacteria bacterium]